nr:bifunctional 4'-phosphopantothenoylcysteine decarboxylase/phosphopantothenoylcysteine synthetase [Candidatus Eremiobacteraeota bacterium]
NASTGSMGIAIAREAAARGARVTLILGPTALPAPADAQTIRVTTAQEMYEVALAHSEDAELTIATAAVSDYRPATVSNEKMKKADAAVALQMVRNPDILKTLGEKKHAGYLVGFAAETHAHEDNALQKLRSKNLDAIAVNDVGAGRGFGLQENTLTLLFADGTREDLGTSSKPELAGRMLDAISLKMGATRDAAGN